MAGKRGSIGIPLCLGFYELLPFWWAFWTKLGFAVHTSPVSSRGLYLAGQATIPSDTACFPGKAEPRLHQGPEPDAAGRYFLPA